MAEDIMRHVNKADVDFIDIRYETKSEAVIHYSSRDLKEIGSNTTDGFVVRVLNKGGMASMAVTRSEDLRRAIGSLMEAANLISKKSGRKTKLASVPAVKDRAKPRIGKDPRGTPIEEKLGILKGYNDLALGRPDICATEMEYFEVCREKHYVSSEGSDINQELVTVGIRGEIMAKKGGEVRNVRVAIGGATGLKNLYGREEAFINKAKIARDLLVAKAVKGGKYNVVLNPSMAGVFTHEAFGHFSEADLIEDNPDFRKRMKLGTKLGSKEITIIADSTMPENLGFYKYDDEGVAVRPVTLMKNGVLVGRLHSRKTAASFKEPVTGHCVAEDHDYPPIIRMGNIYVKPGKWKFDEMLEEVCNGVYLCDGKGGQTNGENFTFGTQYGYLIKNGELGPMIRDTNLMGNLFTTLANIAAAGDDLTFTERGGCGKGVQTNLKSSYGGPHIMIKDAILGGA